MYPTPADSAFSQGLAVSLPESKDGKSKGGRYNATQGELKSLGGKLKGSFPGLKKGGSGVKGKGVIANVASDP